jgi:hypothetical protein
LHIDRTHRKWIIWTAALLVLAALAYFLGGRSLRHGISGGSAVGLIFGSAGYALMLYATLLSVRKKFTRWRIGRAQTWMRGHIWLGLLSYPLILFHGGFRLGSGLTLTLMLIFSVVIITGIGGAILQHYMPRMMTERVAYETIYYQIERVQSQLAQEAEDLLSSLFKKHAQYGLLVPAMEKTHTSATTLVALSEKSGDQLRETYENTIKPYLEQRGAYKHVLNDVRRSKALFADLRTVTPEAVMAVVDGLESICTEKRDLDRQSRMHRILHGWLLAHVPLSFLLIVLGGIHALMAVRYG